MRTREGRTFQSLRAVKAFLDSHSDRLAGVVNTGARRRLDEITASLGNYVATQEGSHLAAQGATKKQQALRRILLRRHMAAIARVAKADLPSSPALDDDPALLANWHTVKRVQKLPTGPTVTPSIAATTQHSTSAEPVRSLAVA